ncbi:DUF2118 domain-containing protein [Thermococcus sp.]|uniref:DUF2118 domain-containing protein n=1 Tax=Thermococcus sp. TaxID=35749 RepID=UPI002600AF90|nr:DUF2118 domain-containing protein [Thermococcus sp.]
MERLPRLYVECDMGECTDGDLMQEECVVIQGNLEVWLKRGDPLPGFIETEKATFLKKEIYDRFYFYVDRVGQRMTVDSIIVLPDGRTRIYLKKGDKLLLLPVEGYTKTLISNVGNRVRRGDAFAAVTTKKGKIHYLKPPKAGTVLFIDEVSLRPHYVYYILPEE